MIFIKGAGDIASGIAMRLYKAGYRLVMNDLSEPSAIRRTVAFSEAIYKGSTTVEHITAVRTDDLFSYDSALAHDCIPVIPISNELCTTVLRSADAIVDARLAKINIDTTIDEADVVIGVGPGFLAGTDCHAVIETQRGHYLGRTYYYGKAANNTGIPGIIGGYGEERVMRAPCDGIFRSVKSIGDVVIKNEVVAYVGNIPMMARIPGLIRGLLPDGFKVIKGMKSGDVDPRNEPDFCDCVSDKALAIAGGVLEALLHFNVFPDNRNK